MRIGNLTTLFAATEHAAEHHEGAWWTPVFWMVVVFFVIVLLLAKAISGSKNMNVPKSYISRLAEHAFLFIENMCLSVIGPGGKKYIPLALTIYLIVLISNLFGLFGLYAPTASFGFTLGLALVVVFYVQYEGIRVLGFKGYIKHFMGPDLGMPVYTILPIFITLLLFFIEVVSEVAKNLSLSLRLQGNISGEHMVGQTLGGLIPISDSFALPIQALLLPLGVFVSLVQALVFTMLTCVYLSLFTSHEAEEAHAH
ncbi:MAG: F0F1 ATP synthase subunit A [Armatimonadetes bacterium]|nr:F0F1 ATP synthase subunit A [Armatimonadota bacterium]